MCCKANHPWSLSGTFLAVTLGPWVRGRKVAEAECHGHDIVPRVRGGSEVPPCLLSIGAECGHPAEAAVKFLQPKSLFRLPLRCRLGGGPSVQPHLRSRGSRFLSLRAEDLHT